MRLDEREREIRERLEKSSNAPWWKAGIYTALRFFSKNYCGDVWDDRPQEAIDAESMPQYGNEADVDLITNAPTDIQHLLSLLDAERKRVQELEGALKQALPYVQGAYECAFPDAEENAYIAEQIESLLSKEQK